MPNLADIMRLKEVVNMSMRDYLNIINEPACERPDFEIFKGNVCHFIKSMGDMKFIIYLLQEDFIRQYWLKKWYPECMYLLATLDYLCRENDLPLCENYEDIRRCYLAETIYPKDVMLSAALSSELDRREESIMNSIPEFIRFNIVECDIRDVY